MLNGHVTVVGTMIVSGEELTGVFVECSMDELRQYARNLVYQDVTVSPAQSKEPEILHDKFGKVIRNIVGGYKTWHIK